MSDLTNARNEAARALHAAIQDIMALPGSPASIFLSDHAVDAIVEYAHQMDIERLKAGGVDVRHEPPNEPLTRAGDARSRNGPPV